MAYKFTYNGAPLVSEQESVIPFKTGLQNYEGEKLECKIYRYKVARDIEIEVFIPKAHDTVAYTRGFLLNEAGEMISWNKTGLGHTNKSFVRGYLKAFTKKNKPGLAWIQKYRNALIKELNDDGFHYVEWSK